MILGVVDVIAQPDAKDPTSIAKDLRDEAKSMAGARTGQIHRDERSELPLSGLRIGVPKVATFRYQCEAVRARS